MISFFNVWRGSSGSDALQNNEKEDIWGGHIKHERGVKANHLPLTLHQVIDLEASILFDMQMNVRLWDCWVVS